MKEFVKMKTLLLSSVIFFKIVMMPLHRKVSSCASVLDFFSVHSQDFPLWANLYQKLPILTIWGGGQ